MQYVDIIYAIVDLLPPKEKHNLKPQMMKAVTSISLNIAEGSTSQSNPEFKRFLRIAIRSCVEIVACLHLSKRRKYIGGETFDEAYAFGEKMFAKLQALIRSLR